MNSVFVIGTAGSGKSTLTAAVSDWLQEKGTDCMCVNLDPGVVHLPYEPAIDSRQFVDINKLVEKYKLGPNGALLMSIDLLAIKADLLSKQINDLEHETAIFDTPGQIELFAFRESGHILFDEIESDHKLIIFLFDGPFCSNPRNYVSTLFLSAAVNSRFLASQVNVLTKSDLLAPKKLQEILSWSKDPEMLSAAIEAQLKGTTYVLSRDVQRAISRLRLDFSLLAVSAKTLSNFVGLQAAIERVFGKED